MLIFADYWPITEFPAILKSEVHNTSCFQTTIVLGSQWLAKNFFLFDMFLCNIFCVFLNSLNKTLKKYWKWKKAGKSRNLSVKIYETIILINWFLHQLYIQFGAQNYFKMPIYWAFGIKTLKYNSIQSWKRFMWSVKITTIITEQYYSLNLVSHKNPKFDRIK